MWPQYKGFIGFSYTNNFAFFSSACPVDFQEILSKWINPLPVLPESLINEI